MENMEQAIEGVLSNPDLMQKIMGMAQALGGPPGASEPSKEEQTQDEIPSLTPDLSQMARIGSMLSKANIDSDQQNLLSALSPYMSSPHIGKLKRAMQAARLAELATSMLGSSQAGGGNV